MDHADARLRCHASAACIQSSSGAVAIPIPGANSKALAKGRRSARNCPGNGDFICSCQASINRSIICVCIFDTCISCAREDFTRSSGQPAARAAVAILSSTVSLKRSVLVVTSSRHSDLCVDHCVNGLARLRAEILRV
jgi:hypothetical protein